MTYRRSSRRDDSLRFEGHEYEIDLKAKNAMALRAVFNDYTGTARKVSSSARRGEGLRRLTGVQTDADPTAVRAWAGSNGIKVNARGRFRKPRGGVT